MSKNFVLDDGSQFVLYEPSSSSQTSFAGPNINTYIKASITLRHKKTGALKTITLINREYSSNIDAFPLLISIDSIGLKLSGNIPEGSRGSITVDNSPSSFGSERRFSDLLNRYTMIEQPVKVWIAEIPVGKREVEDNDFNLEWTAIVVGVNFDSSKLQITMSRSEIPVRLMTYSVNLNSFPNAPSESLGKHLPIVLTSDDETVQVDAIRTTDNYEYDSDTTAIDYVYATTLSNQHKVDRVGSGASSSTYLDMLNRSNKWQRMNLLRKNFFFLGDDFEIKFLGLNNYSFNGTWDPSLTDVAYKLTPGQNCEAGQVIVGIDWFLSTATTANFYNFQPAKFTLNIYSEWNNKPDELIASDTIDCEVDHATRLELQSNSGTASYIYKFKFWLNKAIIIPENSSVFISLSRNDISETYPRGVFSPVQTNNEDNGDSLANFEQYYKINSSIFAQSQKELNAGIVSALPDGPDKTALLAQYNEDTDLYAQTFKDWQSHVINVGRDHFKVYGLAVVDEASNATEFQDGLGFQGFKLIMPQQDSPDLSDLRLIVNTRGLKDDLSGSITGTPSAQLTTPVQQIRCLMREWNGSAWVDKRFDHTKFSDTHTEYNSGRWGIRLAGATSGRTMLSEVLEQVCKESMMMLVPFVSETDYSLGLFCWGTKRTSQYLLSDENARFNGAYISGIESVVNRVQLAFQRTMQNRVEEIIAEGGYKQYQQYLDTDVTLVDTPLDELQTSQAVYGVRVLSQISRDWLIDETSAKGVAALMIRRYLEPEFIVSVQVPISECPDLLGMDVIDINFVNLPAYFGSTHEAKNPLAGTSNQSVDLVKGHYWKRAQKYRCAVIGNELVLRRDEPITRLLTLLVINKHMVL